MTEVRLEDVVEALSRWSLQETAQRDRIRLLEAQVEELRLEIRHAIEQAQQAFELSERHVSLQLVIDSALLATRTRGAENVRTIERQKNEIDQQKARIQGMEAEIRESIDRMVEELELPRNPHRTLRNATTEICVMVVEAKKIIRENL